MGCSMGSTKKKTILSKSVKLKSVALSQNAIETSRVKTGRGRFTINPKHYILKRSTIVHKTYSIGQTIASGNLGKLSVASHIQSGQARTIKSINKTKLKAFKEYENFHNELSALKELDHPNIIKLFEFYEDDENFYIVYEYLQGGELFHYILSCDSFSEEVAAHFVKQILSALCYLHSKGIAHCNLKPESLLLDNTKPLPILKLIDFEYSMKNSEGAKVKRIFEEIRYSAPEVVLNGDYSDMADIWSCGVILFILLSGKPPFEGDTHAELKRNIETCNCNFDTNTWQSVSPEAVKLVKKMLEPKAHKRISASEALLSSWLTGSHSTKIISRKGSSLLDNLRTFHIEKNFQHIVLNFIASNLLNKEESKKLYDKFKELDIDGDGKISCEELFEVYSKRLNEEEAVVEIQKIMDTVDVNGSGFIDYSEFLTACAKREMLLQKKNLEVAFNAFDLDGNGTISKNELVEMLGRVNVQDDIIDGIIKQVDLNQDGVIDLNEFQEMMMSSWKEVTI